MEADGAATHKAPPRAPLGLVICNGTLIISYFCVFAMCRQCLLAAAVFSRECRLSPFIYIMHIFLPFCDIVENFFLFRSAGIGCIGLGINNVGANGNTYILACAFVIIGRDLIPISYHFITPIYCIRLT